MKSFQWDSSFITGIEFVDIQHHRLVDLINEYGVLLSNNTIVFSDVESVIKELAMYAQYHFQEEEGLMHSIAIDPRHMEHHKVAHHDFINEVNLMYENLSEDSLDSANHLLEFLINWLAYHILGSDQNMSRQISLIKSGESPSQAYEKEEKESQSSTVPLLKALNNLFNQISERNKSLIKLNQSLEEKVAARTKELSEANAHLEQLSLSDALTGLPNRRKAIQHLSFMWKDAINNDSSLACIMIDADHFKKVNDTYGHDAGDKVLIELAMTLKHAFRNDDILCRLGGDEFFVICPYTNLEGAVYIAELVRKKVSVLRVETGGKPWCGSISLGVAARISDLKNHEELMKLSDIALYTAKQDGKNCVRT